MLATDAKAMAQFLLKQNEDGAQDGLVLGPLSVLHF